LWLVIAGSIAFNIWFPGPRAAHRPTLVACSPAISANRHRALISRICSIVLVRQFEQAQAGGDAESWSKMGLDSKPISTETSLE
jgi:hypothetical protein